MFTKSLIAQNVIDYGTAINYNYNAEKVYAANSNNDAELYEKSINEMILLSTRYGIDSLSIVQKTELEFIAHFCPFAAGPAVYKARNINKLLNPAMHYDNLKICNEVGVYKQGNSGNTPTTILYQQKKMRWRI